MSDTKFTPGPWNVRADGFAPSGLSVIVGEAEHRGSMIITTDICQIEDQNESEANANLIAAAPDLYEALSELSNMYASTWDVVGGGLMMMDRGVQRFEAAHEKAIEALKKARGES